MRGKVIFSPFEVYSDRITPAYAGKSGRDTCSAAPHKDHPRLCGEKPKTRASPKINAGSPPPMRGKAFDANGDVTAAGITPAYAGKRQSFHRLYNRF